MTDAISETSNVLDERELDSVSAGAIKGALQGVCTRGGGQNDAAQMFQQILQQLSQG